MPTPVDLGRHRDDFIISGRTKLQDGTVCCLKRPGPQNILDYPEDLYAEICGALHSDVKYFSPMDIKEAQKLGSLQKVKTSPSVCLLVIAMSEAGLESQIGYNVSTGEISFTVQIKVCRSVFGALFAWAL